MVYGNCAQKLVKKIWCHEDKDIRGKRQIFVILNYYFFIFICSDISFFSNSLLSYIFFFTFCNYDSTIFFFHWTDWLELVRATAIVGFISLLFALVLIILKIFVMKDKKNILFVAIGSTFVGGKIYVDNVIRACHKNCDIILKKSNVTTFTYL